MNEEKSGMKTVWLMLLGGAAFGLLIGVIITYVPDDDPREEPVLTETRADASRVATEKKDGHPIAFSQKVLALLATPDSLYLSRPGAGVFRTTDGENWETLRIGMETPREVLALVEVKPTPETLAAKLIELSAAQGRTPNPEELKEALMTLAQQKPGVLAGMRDGRILRFDNESWKVISNLPADGGGVHALRYEPAVGLAACTGRGLFFSETGGHAWTAVTTNSLTRDVLIGLDPRHRFIVAHIGDGISSCTAQGQCEKIIGAPDQVRCLSGDKALAKTYFGTDGDGLWLYKRGQKPEQVTSNALETADIHGIARRGARIFVAAGPAGLWLRKSPESGWFPGRNLPPDSITSVAVFKGRVYAGSQRYGLFSADLNDADFKPEF